MQAEADRSSGRDDQARRPVRYPQGTKGTDEGTRGYLLFRAEDPLPLCGGGYVFPIGGDVFRGERGGRRRGFFEYSRYFQAYGKRQYATRGRRNSRAGARRSIKGNGRG